MPEEPTNQPTDAEAAAATAAAEAAATAAAESAAAETDEAKAAEAAEAAKKAAEATTELSLEDATAALTKTRTEAASWRTKYRELEKKFEGAKTPEEIAAIIEENNKTNATEVRELLVKNVILEHKLPDALAATIQQLAASGASEEVLQTQAKALAAFAPAEESEPHGAGGLDPDGASGAGAFDAVAEARKVRASRRY